MKLKVCNYWRTFGSYHHGHTLSDDEVNQLIEIEQQMGAGKPEEGFSCANDSFGSLRLAKYELYVKKLEFSAWFDAVNDELPECEAHFRRIHDRIHACMRGQFGELVRIARIAEYILTTTHGSTELQGKAIFTVEEIVQEYNIERFGMTLQRTASALDFLHRYSDLMIPRFKFKNTWYYDLEYAARSTEERKFRQNYFKKCMPNELAQLVSKGR